MNGSPHPDGDRLTAYLLGKLSWAEIEKIEGHLGSCPECRARVGVLEESADSFVSCLRGDTGMSADETAMAKLLVCARAITEPTLTFADAQHATLSLVDAAPKIVAGCELVDAKGIAGGLGVVYKAYHRVLKDFRAIKRPRTRDRSERDLLYERFQREVEAVGALRDDHIVRAHDAGSDAEGPYLVMEYLDGASLSGLLAQHGPLSAADACELIRQAALGLQAAHECGLVHRDIKPSNLMLARTGGAMARVVVIDWGLVLRRPAAISNDRAAADSLTPQGVAVGTADYIAPEQTRDAGAVDIRADVYSLGVTLYCLLTGQPPFHGRPVPEKLLAHQREAFPPLEQARADLPGKLVAVVKKMVEKDPSRRYATPGEAAAALKPLCPSEPRLIDLLGTKAAPANTGKAMAANRLAGGRGGAVRLGLRVARLARARHDRARSEDAAGHGIGARRARRRPGNSRTAAVSPFRQVLVHRFSCRRPARRFRGWRRRRRHLGSAQTRSAANHSALSGEADA